MKFMKQLSDGSVSLVENNSFTTSSSPSRPAGDDASKFAACYKVNGPGLEASELDTWTKEFLGPCDNNEAMKERLDMFYKEYPLGVKSDEWINEYSEEEPVTSGTPAQEEHTDWYNDVPVSVRIIIDFHYISIVFYI